MENANISNNFRCALFLGQVLNDVVVSVVDWYPTFLEAAGAEVGYHRSTRLYNTENVDTRFDGENAVTVPLDGSSIWRAIQTDTPSQDILYDEREVLLDLNSASSACSLSSCGAIRRGSWKFLRGGSMAQNKTSTDGLEWDTRWTSCDDSKLRFVTFEMT